jgi:hypothetical protein
LTSVTSYVLRNIGEKILRSQQFKERTITADYISY